MTKRDYWKNRSNIKSNSKQNLKSGQNVRAADTKYAQDKATLKQNKEHAKSLKKPNAFSKVPAKTKELSLKIKDKFKKTI